VRFYGLEMPFLKATACAATTTSLQTPATTEQKMQPKTQAFGCGCAKGFFRTTTNTKNKPNTTKRQSNQKIRQSQPPPF
jgi:hypothetical protein